MVKALRNYTNGNAAPTRPVTKPVANVSVDVQNNLNQVRSNAGGYVFQVTDETRLTRFLILGTDGGTYYVNELDLTKQNVEWLRQLIRRDSDLVLRTAVEISDAGRAYRNDAAIFVMALLLAEGTEFSKRHIVAAVPKVVRTATHAYQLADFIEHLGGWGPAKMAAIREWFYSKNREDLAYQAVKYRSRYGWTGRDLLRLSHPGSYRTALIDDAVAQFVLSGRTTAGAPLIVQGFEKMQRATTLSQVLRILNDYPNLPWETIPTQFHKEPAVWRTLFNNGQLKGQALLRNVTRLAKLGLFTDSGFRPQFADKLRDEDMIARTRLHPMQYLNAYVIYNEGQGRQLNAGWSGGIERERSWVPDPSILDALDDGFGLAFGNVEPANKRTMISIDTSGSMSWYLAGNTQLSAYQAAGAMGLITLRTEPRAELNAFSSGRTVRDVGITDRDSLGTATTKLIRAGGGGTNISLPMASAREYKHPVDTFVVITDNEVNMGGHPYKELENYRQAMGIDARLVVMAVVATEFTVANPDDAGMLDVVGFDTNTPAALADFSAGRV